MAGVWILAEYVEQSKELLNVGRELAGQVGVELAAGPGTRIGPTSVWPMAQTKFFFCPL